MVKQTVMRLLCCIFILGSLLSCKKEPIPGLSEKSVLVFGHFYGECEGEFCIETFKLTDDTLFEDTIDDFYGQDFNFVALEQDKFELVKNLTDFFPSELLKETDSILGCPDCDDGGGLFVQIETPGEETRSWKIEQNKAMVPGYLHNFMDKINESITSITK